MKKTKLLSHVAMFVAVGLFMLASPAMASPTRPSTVQCSSCTDTMGQSILPMSGSFPTMIGSRFRFDGDNQDGNGQGGPNFFTGGDIVSSIKFFEDSDDQGDQNDQGDTPSATPEPGTLLLLGSGLIGLAFLVRRTT